MHLALLILGALASFSVIVFAALHIFMLSTIAGGAVSLVLTLQNSIKAGETSYVWVRYHAQAKRICEDLARLEVDSTQEFEKLRIEMQQLRSRAVEALPQLPGTSA